MTYSEGQKYIKHVKDTTPNYVALHDVWLNCGNMVVAISKGSLVFFEHGDVPMTDTGAFIDASSFLENINKFRLSK